MINQDCTHKTRHRHGTSTCYVRDRCRCGYCRAANTATAKYRERRKLYGRYDDLVDAEPVRRHIRRLMTLGMGWKRIARAAGVATSTVYPLLYGKHRDSPTHPEHRPPRKRITKEVAEKLLAVELQLAPGALVDDTGTVRRLRALQVQGWSLTALAHCLGWQTVNLWKLLNSPTEQVSKGTHDAAIILFNQLSRAVPTNSQPSRVSQMALARGWAPAAAWDDFDNPAERPKGVLRRSAA